MNTYELLLACWLSGQISDQKWLEHLKDEVFRKWLARRDRRAKLEARERSSSRRGCLAREYEE